VKTEIRTASPLFRLTFTVDRQGRVKKRRSMPAGVHVRYVKRGLYRVSCETLRARADFSAFVKTEALGLVCSVRRAKLAKDAFFIDVVKPKDWYCAVARRVTPSDGIRCAVHVEVFAPKVG
jgi:hypothetical protein